MSNQLKYIVSDDLCSSQSQFEHTIMNTEHNKTWQKWSWRGIVCRFVFKVKEKAATVSIVTA